MKHVYRSTLTLFLSILVLGCTKTIQEGYYFPSRALNYATRVIDPDLFKRDPIALKLEGEELDEYRRTTQQDLGEYLAKSASFWELIQGDRLVIQCYYYHDPDTRITCNDYWEILTIEMSPPTRFPYRVDAKDAKIYYHMTAMAGMIYMRSCSGTMTLSEAGDDRLELDLKLQMVVDSWTPGQTVEKDFVKTFVLNKSHANRLPR